MKAPLLVVGAGNVGGYLAWNLRRIATDYELLGFLDDDPAKHGTVAYGKPVLGPVEALRHYQGAAVLVGIASPAARARIAVELSAHTDNFPSFVAPNAWISDGVRIGHGVILYPGCAVNYETVIGDFCILNMNCALGHNCTLEGFDTLAPGVNLAGFTYVEPRVDIGIGVSTRQRVRIGAGAIIGGQAMLISDVAPGTTVVGVPARVLARGGSGASLCPVP